MIRRISRIAAAAALASAASWSWAGPGPAPVKDDSDNHVAAAQAQEKIQEMQEILSVLYSAQAQSGPGSMHRSAESLDALRKDVMDILDPTGLTRATLSLSRDLDHLFNEVPDRSAKDLISTNAGLSAIEAKLVALADPDLQAKIERRRHEKSAARAVKLLRTAVSLYTRDHDGWPPMDPAQRLVPGYVSAIPVLDLPGHKPRSAIRILRKVADEAALEDQFTDDGGWIYVADLDSPFFGQFFIDCRHEDAKGRPWFKH
jgi:hypothetical protein